MQNRLGKAARIYNLFIPRIPLAASLHFTPRPTIPLASPCMHIADKGQTNSGCSGKRQSQKFHGNPHLHLRLHLSFIRDGPKKSTSLKHLWNLKLLNHQVTHQFHLAGVTAYTSRVDWSTWTRTTQGHATQTPGAQATAKSFNRRCK